LAAEEFPTRCLWSLGLDAYGASTSLPPPLGKCSTVVHDRDVGTDEEVRLKAAVIAAIILP